MNPLAQAALGSILRWVLTLAAGYLVKAGIWTGSEAETYVTAAALAGLGLGWSLWKNYHGRLKFLTALMMPEGSTENDVKAHLDSGAPTPPVSTPKNEAPSLPPAA
jgi:hypothetical protein